MSAAFKRAVVIANHQAMLDIPVIHRFAAEFGQGQNPRWLGKKSFKRVPLLGWGAELSGMMIWLHRDWARDQEGLQASLRELAAAPRPFWLCFFPEGTRMTPAKRAASQQHARAKHYPVLQQVLLPRPKGFTAAVHGLRAHVDAVLDVSIYYSQRPPFIASVVRGRRVAIVVRCNVIEPDALPHADADLKQYLLDLYRDKDAQMFDLEKNNMTGWNFALILALWHTTLNAGTLGSFENTRNLPGYIELQHRNDPVYKMIITPGKARDGVERRTASRIIYEDYLRDDGTIDTAALDAKIMAIKQHEHIAFLTYCANRLPAQATQVQWCKYHADTRMQKKWRKKKITLAYQFAIAELQRAKALATTVNARNINQPSSQAFLAHLMQGLETFASINEQDPGIANPRIIVRHYPHYLSRMRINNLDEAANLVNSRGIARKVSASAPTSVLCSSPTAGTCRAGRTRHRTARPT